MQGLAQKAQDFWGTKLTDADRNSLMKSDNRTEIFRRVPGFLELYSELLGGLSIPQPDPTTAALINALLNHLNCNAGYYTEQYLRFAWNKLGNTFVIRLTNDILSGLFAAPAGYVSDTSRPYLNLYEVETVQRSGLSVLVPLQFGALPGNSTVPNFVAGLTQLNNAIGAAAAPAPTREIGATDLLHLL